MPWSIACLITVRLSCGEALLSSGTISNLTSPAHFSALAFSAMNCQLRSRFCPTGAIIPDSGSIQAILTVPFSSPAAGIAGLFRCACAGWIANAVAIATDRVSARNARIE